MKSKRCFESLKWNPNNVLTTYKAVIEAIVRSFVKCYWADSFFGQKNCIGSCQKRQRKGHTEKLTSVNLLRTYSSLDTSERQPEVDVFPFDAFCHHRICNCKSPDKQEFSSARQVAETVQQKEQLTSGCLSWLMDVCAWAPYWKENTQLFLRSPSVKLWIYLFHVVVLQRYQNS